MRGGGMDAVGGIARSLHQAGADGLAHGAETEDGKLGMAAHGGSLERKTPTGGGGGGWRDLDPGQLVVRLPPALKVLGRGWTTGMSIMPTNIANSAPRREKTATGPAP